MTYGFDLFWRRGLLALCFAAFLSCIQVNAVSVHVYIKHTGSGSGPSTYVDVWYGGVADGSVTTLSSGTAASIIFDPNPSIFDRTVGTFSPGAWVAVFQRDYVSSGSPNTWQFVASFKVPETGDPGFGTDPYYRPATGYYEVYRGYTPPAPSYCIDVDVANTTEYVLHYAVFQAFSPAPGFEDVPVDPGEHLVVGLSSDDATRPVVQVFRPTEDGGSRLVYQSVSSDWYLCSGTPVENNLTNSTAFANVPPINWQSPTNSDGSPKDLATDTNNVIGFEKLYGATVAGFNLTLDQLRAENQKLTAGNASLVTISSGIAAGNSANSLYASTNSTRLIGLSNLSATANGYLSNIANGTGGTAVETNILVSLEKSRTNALAGQNIFATNWSDVGKSMLGLNSTNGFDLEKQRLEAMQSVSLTHNGSDEANLYALFGTYAFAADNPGDSIWTFTFKGIGPSHVNVTKNFNPFQFTFVQHWAGFSRRFISWICVAWFYYMAYKKTFEATEAFLKVPAMTQGVLDIATAGTWALAKRVIFSGLVAAIPTFVGVYFSGMALPLNFIRESPLYTSSSVVRGSLYLTEQFIPLTVIWGLLKAYLLFWFVLQITTFITSAIWKIVPAIALGFLLQSSQAVEKFVLNNPTQGTILFEWTLDADTLDSFWLADVPVGGVYVRPHSSFEVPCNPDTWQTNIRIWYMVGGETNSANLRKIGDFTSPEPWWRTNWGGLGVSDSTGTIGINFGQFTGGQIYVSEYWLENSPWYSFHKGWSTAVIFLGLGMAIWIIRKLYPTRPPSEL